MAEEWTVRTGHRDLLGEGPLWSAGRNALFWVDLELPALRSLDLADGSEANWPMSEPIGFVIEDARGKLIVGLASGLYRVTLPSHSLDFLVDPMPHRPDLRINDATVDPAGRLWLGTMTPDGEEAAGALVRVDAALDCRVVDPGYHIPNGPAFDRAGRRLYHADSLRRIIYRFEIEDGLPVRRHDHIRFDDPAGGLPDGMTVDAEDHLWVAHWDGGRISRFDPDGRLVRQIALPASRITSCAFGGAALDRLFVTSARYEREDEPFAGMLFEVETGTRGFAQPAFAV